MILDNDKLFLVYATDYTSYRYCRVDSFCLCSCVSLASGLRHLLLCSIDSRVASHRDTPTGPVTGAGGHTTHARCAAACTAWVVVLSDARPVTRPPGNTFLRTDSAVKWCIVPFPTALGATLGLEMGRHISEARGLPGTGEWMTPMSWRHSVLGTPCFIMQKQRNTCPVSFSNC